MKLFKDKKSTLHKRGRKPERIKENHSVLYPLFIERAFGLEIKQNLNTY